MLTKIASSPSDIISTSGTCDEIVPVEDTATHSSSTTNSIPIEPTHSIDNKESEKPKSIAVADQPKSKNESSAVTSRCLPSKSKPENPNRKSIGDKPTSSAADAGGGDPRSNQSNPNENNKSDGNDNDRDRSETEGLRRVVFADLRFITQSSETIKSYEGDIQRVYKRYEKLRDENGSEKDFRELKVVVKKLKQKIFSKHKDETEGSSKHKDEPHSWSDITENIGFANADNVLDVMPKLHDNDTFAKTSEFKEFEARYHELGMELKLCLLCFSVFPENVEIKKRVMIYWWIGEGFAPPVKIENTDKRTAEQYANEYFNELIVKGFIEPVCKRRSRGVEVCKMHPFVRSMVIKLAKRAKFFDFDEEGDAMEEYTNSFRACLTGKGLSNINDPEKLHALFNVNEAILEFKLEWLAKMKHVNFLYLGRWQTSAMHHIEVEDIKTMKMKIVNVLDGLENAKHLRFLSLQGISRIMKLPESILKLTNLTILDIRACHNLETIPDGIGSLKNLTHLDMSECYLLDQMPKELSFLSKLEVLGGFVIGDSEGKSTCTLSDLLKLTNLRKLSIHTGVNGFPSETDLCALNQYKALRKLTIAWGRVSAQSERDDIGRNVAVGGTPKGENREDNKKKDICEAEKGTPTSKKLVVQRSLARATTTRQSAGTPSRDISKNSKNKDISDQEVATPKKLGIKRALSKTSTFKAAEEPPVPELPSELIKLDLRCFPRLITPTWLRARNLKKLTKLYVRGGKFCDLGQFQDLEDDEGDDEKTEKDQWGIEDLRLKYLNELEMDWSELQELFPRLNYLEKVKCPKLTFFPCDENGVWMKKTVR